MAGILFPPLEMYMLKRIETVIDKIILVIVSIVTLVMITSTFLQVVFRYFFSNPLFWSEELARYCFIYIVFIGGAWAGKNLSHLGVDYFVNKLPIKAKSIVNCLIDLLIIGFSFAISIIAMPVIRINMNQLSPALHIPMGLVYLAVPLGFIFCAFYYFTHLPTDIFSLKGGGKTC